jgi:hypothetical protein
MGLLINLDQSRRTVQGAYQNYWLNCDGTVTEKTFFGRIIRWIENYFFNTTLSDICMVFQSTIRSYLRTYNDFVRRMGNVTKEDLNAQAKRVCFVAQFLASRTPRLLASPQFAHRVQGYLNLLPIDSANKTLNHLQDLDLDTEEPHVKALHAEDAVFPHLTDEVLARKAPLIELQFNAGGDITDLLVRYDELAPNRAPAPDNLVLWGLWKIANWWREMQEKSGLRQMCKDVKRRNRIKYNHPHRKEAYKQIELHLLQCNQLLQDSTIAADKRWQALYEIVKASSDCVPRWMTESERQTDFLAEKMVPVEALVLHWKELLILDFIQETIPNAAHTNHYLNAIAARWGNQFGLDAVAADLDMHKEPITDEEVERLLETIRKAWQERGLNAFRERINCYYRPEIFDTLIAAVAHAGIENAQDFVMDEYYDAQGKITNAGVVRLLRATLMHRVLVE